MYFTDDTMKSGFQPLFGIQINKKENIHEYRYILIFLTVANKYLKQDKIRFSM